MKSVLRALRLRRTKKKDMKVYHQSSKVEALFKSAPTAGIKSSFETSILETPYEPTLIKFKGFYVQPLL